MKKCEKGRKLNNRGMSLIEILVAIIILAVVTGPLLHSFVTAIKLNSKAKEQQRVITAAQSIMEGFKAYTLEELCMQFYQNQATVDPSPANSGFYVVANAGGVKEIDTMGNPYSSISSVPDGEGTALVFTPSLSNEYAFSLENVDFEGQKYDAKVELEPLTVADMAAVPAVTNLASIEDFDVDTTAAYDQTDENMDAVAASAIVDKLWTEGEYTWRLIPDRTGETEAEVKAKILENLKINKKTTKLEIESATEWKAGATVTSYTVKVQILYSYEVASYTYTYPNPYNPAAADLPETITTSPGSVYLQEDGTVLASGSGITYATIYPTDETKDASKLKSISFCYYPAYDYSSVGSSVGSGVSIEEECFEISSWSPNPAVNVSLIKQRHSGIGDDAKLSTLESTYIGMINTMGDDSFLKLGTNITAEGSNIKENLADAITPAGDMVTEKPQVLIYKVQVSVYRAGEAAGGFAGEPLVVLDGTMYD